MARNRSFLQSYTWIWLFLVLFGAVFLTVGIIMQLVPMEPAGMNYYVNGVRQAATDSTVRNFRLVFLLAFGLTGLIITSIGVIVAIRTSGGRRLGKKLKRDGVRVIAEVTDYEASSVTVNHRPLMRLHCAYTDSSRRTYVFKSGALRKDPVPYLKDGKVTVYYDRNNMSRYFVDVDGSVGLGTTLIDL